MKAAEGGGGAEVGQRGFDNDAFARNRPSADFEIIGLSGPVSCCSSSRGHYGVALAQ